MPTLRIHSDDCVRLAALCRIVGCSKTTGGKLRDKGVFVTADGRFYSLAENVPRYLTYLESGAATPEGAAAALSLNEERRRKLKLENDRREASLIPFDLHSKFCHDHLAIYRNTLAGTADRIAQQVENLTPAETRALILAEHRRVLNQCADQIEAGAYRTLPS